MRTIMQKIKYQNLEGELIETWTVEIENLGVYSSPVKPDEAEISRLENLYRKNVLARPTLKEREKINQG